MKWDTWFFFLLLVLFICIFFTLWKYIKHVGILEIVKEEGLRAKTKMHLILKTEI